MASLFTREGEIAERGAKESEDGGGIGAEVLLVVILVEKFDIEPFSDFCAK